MWWKDWSYANRGWWIIFIISALLIILWNYFDNWKTFRCGFFETSQCNFFIFILDPFQLWIPVVIFSLIGALIGYLYGKFKNKNN